MQQEAFMARAIALSRSHMEAGHGGPFGAVIVRKGEIVAEGYNKVTSSNDPTAHAEVVAIREACQKLGTFELSDCELYTSCEPCPMCLASAYWARIPVIYYANTREDAAAIGFDDAHIYDELAKPIQERSIVMQTMLRSEAWKVFQAWEAKEDKTRY
jgi:tRNA(Arg) A34 adenosine deaminase TadA